LIASVASGRGVEAERMKLAGLHVLIAAYVISAMKAPGVVTSGWARR
jgi:hypothetical protein